MKNILFLCVFAVSSTLSAQKTVYVFNYSSYNVEVGNFQSKDGNSDWPQYASVNSQFIIPSGQSYTLSNPSLTRFPFESVNSSPYIGFWSQQASSSSSGSAPIASYLLDLDPIANPQVFYYFKFMVKDRNGNYLGGGTLISGEGPVVRELWQASLSINGAESVIMILDN